MNSLHDRRRRSNYAIVSSFTDANRVRIVKLIGLNLGGLSVTNDAEGVVDDVLRQYHPNFPGTARYGARNGVRIFYRDSCGNVDELLNDGDRFTGFAPARDVVVLNEA